MAEREPRAAFPGGERFELVGELGRGGMGVVYDVLDRDRRIRLALKGLRKVAPRAILRLKREFRAVRDVHHPNLVRLDELFEHDGAWFFTMELVEGVDLLAWVRPGEPRRGRATRDVPDGATAATRADGVAARRAPAEPAPGVPASAASGGAGSEAFDRTRLRAALRGLVGALAALHRAGVVHRDVKPSNVLVDRSGRVVLLDFGVVSEIAAREREIVGTYAYMAPEQATGDDVGPAADWYALGVVLFEAMTGDVPFAGAAGLDAKVAVDAPSPRARVADLPPDLVDLCERLLRRDPRARPDARELLAFVGLADDDTGPAFVGRGAELAALHAAFDAVGATGAARAVVVAGESGIGKTALARRFLDGIDALVLPARCDERELVSYNALDGAVDALARHLGALPADAVEAPGGTAELLRIFPVLRGVAALAAAPPPPPSAAALDPRALAFAALADLFAAAAARRPVVLFVDDLHWADADSVALLGELFGGADAPAVLLLATARGAPEGELAAAIRVPLDVIGLGGLPRAEAEALVRATAPGADAARLADETGGHPLFLAELARRHGAGGVRLDDALWQRIGELDDGARALLEIVAIGGAPLPVGAVPAAAGLGPDGFARALDVLRGARLVRVTGTRDHDAIEPYHDRVRETVASRLPVERRRAGHAALAASLEAGGAAVEVLAYHLAEAGDGARAAALAEAAARRAIEGLAFDRAAEWIRLTLALGDLPPPRRRALAVLRADLLARAGRTAEAADAFLAAAEAEPPEVARELHRRAAEELLIGGHLARGRAVALRLAAEVGVEPPASTAGAVARLLWYQARLSTSRLRWPRRAAADVAERDRIRIDVAWSLAIGLSMVDSTRGACLAMRAPLLAMPAGDAPRIARALAAAAVGAAAMGHRRLTARLRGAAHRAAADDPDGALYAALADVGHDFYLANDWRGALAGCARAAALCRVDRGHTFEADVVEQHHLWTLYVLGELREVRRRVPPAIRSAQRIGNRFVEVSLRTFFPVVHLIGDRAAEALADVRDALAAWQPDDGEVTNPFFFALKSRSLIACYRGDPATDPALDADWARLRRSLLHRIPIIAAEACQWGGQLALSRAAVARAGGDAGAAAAHVGEARRWAARARRVGLPAGVQMADLLEAAIAVADGDREVAARRLGVLLDHLDATAQRGFAAGARWRLGAVLGGAAGAAHRAAARAYFSGEGVACPERMVDALFPGA